MTDREQRAQEVARGIVAAASTIGPFGLIDERKITEAIATALLSFSEPEWQPIETAPKDDRWLHGLGNDGSIYRISWGRNHADILAWCTSFGSFVDGYITHWTPEVPLPAAPQPDKEGGR